jgi:hypothetical protein
MTYHERVLAYESQGMTTSDAQSVVDVELLKEAAPSLLAALIEVQQTIALEQFGLLNVVNEALAKVHPQLDRRN